MELSKEVMTVLHRAVLYAKENGYEYVTPETILLALAEEGLFIEAFSSCGGDVNLLKKMLEEYISEYVDKVSGKEPELSSGVNKMLMLGIAVVNGSKLIDCSQNGMENLCITVSPIHGLKASVKRMTSHFMESTVSGTPSHHSLLIRELTL